MTRYPLLMKIYKSYCSNFLVAKSWREISASSMIKQKKKKIKIKRKEKEKLLTSRLQLLLSLTMLYSARMLCTLNIAFINEDINRALFITA
jgi:hypothetical protein